MLNSAGPGVIEFVVPGDPNQNTGGYRYVRKLVQALNDGGVTARTTGLPGQFPQPDAEATAAMDRCLSAFAEDTLVVLDGLAMGGLPDVIEKHRSRLQLVALVHHPLADETGLSEDDQRWLFDAERQALAMVGRVLTTSQYTATRLADFGVSASRLATAQPGVEEALSTATDDRHLAKGAPTPVQLLCVGHLSRRKAQHHLLEALSELRGLSWQCTLAGALDRDLGYSQFIRAKIEELGLQDRVLLTGEVADKELADLYRASDIFVFPSVYEGYGMVLDEALSAGLPAICSDGGALKQTGARPGVVQYGAADVSALRDCLRAWLEDASALEVARAQARAAAQSVRTWADTAREFMVGLSLAPEAGHEQSIFDQDWLALREPVDHRSRAAALLTELVPWLETHYAKQQSQGRSQPLMFADLGAGRGSNAVFLAPKLTARHQWLLLDQDGLLLASAMTRLQDMEVAAETSCAQLTTESLQTLLPRELSLITASALIDLVSDAWLAALAEAAAAREAAVLIVLSYAGEFDLSPSHPDDPLLKDLVNRHQHGDKGIGAALGPDATDALSRHLSNRGYSVHISESPWQLAGADAGLAEKLMVGWVSAAAEQDHRQARRLTEWLSVRRQQLAAGTLKIRVQHKDLLALPSPGAA